VCTRGLSGKFPNALISLSVKSMQSWSCGESEHLARQSSRLKRFGLLLRLLSFQWLVSCGLHDRENMKSMKLFQSKCSICPFQARTSKVKFALSQRVEVGEGIQDELCCQPHYEGIANVGASAGYSMR